MGTMPRLVELIPTRDDARVAHAIRWGRLQLPVAGADQANWVHPPQYRSWPDQTSPDILLPNGGEDVAVETVTVTEAKAGLSRLLRRVLDGDEIAIGRRGQPEVVLRRYRDEDDEPRPLGQYSGPYRMDNEFFEADAEVEQLFHGND